MQEEEQGDKLAGLKDMNRYLRNALKRSYPCINAGIGTKKINYSGKVHQLFPWFQSIF